MLTNPSQATYDKLLQDIRAYGVTCYQGLQIFDTDTFFPIRYRASSDRSYGRPCLIASYCKGGNETPLFIMACDETRPVSYWAVCAIITQYNAIYSGNEFVKPFILDNIKI